MARSTTEKERKVAYGVSLTKAQRAVFVQIGGSRWLQATLDRLAEQAPRTPRTPERRAA